MGGTIVQSDEEAAALHAREPELEVEEGDELELPPCLPDHYLARIQEEEGRPCPRPGLAIEDDTGLALEAMNLSMAEHTRHLVEGTLRDLPRGERAATRRRVAAALLDPIVLRRLYPRLKREGADG